MDTAQGYRQERGQVPDCPECVGSVALLRAGDIGRKVWLQPPEGEMVGPFLVVDCARLADIPPLLARNWVVDVSYDLGQLWRMNRPMEGVTVWPDPGEAHFADDRFIGSVRAPTPFYLDPREVVISAPTPASTAMPTSQPEIWPTRLPVALGGAAGQRTADQPPIAVSETPSPLPPTPLTPIVTTPTPPGYRLPPLPTETPQPTPTPTPSSTATDSMSVGRPGLTLLVAPDPGETPVPALMTPEQPASRATVRWVSTPRATSAPILSAPGTAPTPQPPEEIPPVIIRIWRNLLSLVLR
jgi:hypothetical protein